jgi:WhiB family transcriptional regulator, redox-sensing transcriptional regulator
MAALTYRPYDWRANAACVGLDPERFFPLGTTGRALDQIARAKAICQRCEVRAQCLHWALETNQDAGVWGGTSEEERRALRRALQRRVRKLCH